MRIVFFLLYICFATAGVCAGEPLLIFVSLDGNDHFSGSLPSVNSHESDGPFETLTRARDTIRELKRKKGLPVGGVVVNIKGGEYLLAAPFDLSEEDSGTPKSPIVYRAYNNEKVRLIGGRELKGFTPVTDQAILMRLDKESRPNVLRVNLRSSGVYASGVRFAQGFGRPLKSSTLDLYVDDEPMTLARWPNRGWAMTDKASEDTKGCFIYSGDRPSRWGRSNDIWVHGYWKWDWADSFEKIKSINTSKREIETEKPYPALGFAKNKRWYAENILEELDSPSEWFFDAKNGELYLYPPKPLQGARVFVSQIESIVRTKDTSFVSFEGIEFLVSRGTAIEISGGSGLNIVQSTIKNAGTQGIVIDNAYRTLIENCTIAGTGAAAIRISGGDRKTLTRGDNIVRNSHIYNWARRIRTYQPAVSINGVGNIIDGNNIHDAPHAAILLKGNDHIIENNFIHHVGLETKDSGAFYMGRDFSEAGNIVRHNVFYSLGKGDVHAIYLDDFASGTRVEENFIWGAHVGVFVAGGHANIVRGNCFVNTQEDIRLDARGLTWAKKYFDGTDNDLWRKLESVPFKKDLYRKHYGSIVSAVEQNPALPQKNEVFENTSWGGRGISCVSPYKCDEYQQRGINILPRTSLFHDVAQQDPISTLQHAATACSTCGWLKSFAKFHESALTEAGKEPYER